MSSFIKALNIVVDAHQHQTDKMGAPYLLHLIRVMQRGETEMEQICGLLHDLVEDTDWTFEMLEKEGFSPEVIDVLKLVTKINEEENYDSFIERIKQNPIAVRVKINDLKDNMDITRLNEISERDRLRLNKYIKAYKSLIA